MRSVYESYESLGCMNLFRPTMPFRRLFFRLNQFQMTHSIRIERSVLGRTAQGAMAEHEKLESSAYSKQAEALVKYLPQWLL